MRMDNLPGPGARLRELSIQPLGFSVTRVAEAIGASRRRLYAIVHFCAGICPEMAIRPGKAFGTSAENRINQQVQNCLWFAGQHSQEVEFEHLSAA